MKTSKAMVAVALIAGISSLSSATYARDKGRGSEGAPVVYVTSQGLFYDSIVVADPIPNKGRFQQLTMGENGLTTEFGPGEVGHLGGRWWLDLTDDGIMNEGDKFFLCPLLGPGRETM
jgi:hypothetical protein